MPIVERLDPTLQAGGGHPLHYEGGAEYVWALASDLFRLRQAEAKRQAALRRCPYMRLVRRLRREGL